jgi:sulfur carrier protein
MSLTLTVNGQSREFSDLDSPSTLIQVVAEMDLKGDRVAVEHNGEIAQRARWAELAVNSGDRLEIVHFVGGGVESVTRTGWLDSEGEELLSWTPCH